MKDQRNPVVLHGAAVAAIAFAAVFLWNILETRNEPFFWSALLVKGGFLLMIEAVLWSFVIHYARGDITDGPQLGSFLVDQLIFIGLVVLLVYVAAHIRYGQGLQVIHGVEILLWVSLFMFWIFSKRNK